MRHIPGTPGLSYVGSANKKCRCHQMQRHFYVLCELFLRDSASWASTCTSTTVDTAVRIDFEFAVAFADSAYWTSAFAASTADTFIANYICHYGILLFRIEICEL